MGIFRSFNVAYMKNKQALLPLPCLSSSCSDNLKFTTQAFNMFQGEHYHMKTL